MSTSGDRSMSRSRSRSRTPAGRSPSRSPSPGPRRTRSPARDRSYSRSRSASPKQQQERRGRTMSRTPSPAAARSRTKSDSRSRSRSRSYSPDDRSYKRRARHSPETSPNRTSKRHNGRDDMEEGEAEEEGELTGKRRSRSPSSDRSPRSRSNSRDRSRSLRRGGRSDGRRDNYNNNGRRDYKDGGDRKRKLSPPPSDRVFDYDPVRRRERERQLEQRERRRGHSPEPTKPKMDLQTLQKSMATTTITGGVYIPPARLRQMQEQITDKSSKEYQRLAWEALKKSINGLINKVTASNIKAIIPELFGENLIRGQGLFCRSIMRAQAASLQFTPVYAAVVAVVNTKLPQIGELLLTRLILQFRKAYKRNDKTACLAATTFIAHLTNQWVAHEILALKILFLLLGQPTDDSVEIAVGFMKEVGAFLAQEASGANEGVFERLRNLLHEGKIDKRVQYMVEVLFQIRKDKYKENPSIPQDLDLVEEEDQITHTLELDEEDLDPKEELGIFRYDPDYLENEEKYKKIKAEILGEDSDDESGESGSEEEEEEEDEDEKAMGREELQRKMEIQDRTNTNLVNLRKTIYLTIKSSLNYEECCHKLMLIQLEEGQEIEMCNMIIECCSQERTYESFYGLVGERFAKLNRKWSEAFKECFVTNYETIHRLETNPLRNVAKYFGHLLSSDALSWDVLQVIHLNEEETTSSSRIFIKILFQDLVEGLGLKTLNERIRQAPFPEWFAGLFPRDNPKNTRFAINYFTSIGLGALTVDLREHLKNAPKAIMAQQQEDTDSDTDSDSDSSSDDSDSSSASSSDSETDVSSSGSDGSDSESDYSRRSSSRSRSPRSPTPPPRSSRRSSTPPRRTSSRRSPTPRSRSRTPPPAASSSSKMDRERSPPPRARNRSRSPPPPSRGRSRSRSRTPPSRRRSVSRDSYRRRSRSRSPRRYDRRR